MEKLLNSELESQIKDMLRVMKDKVNVVFFNEEGNESSGFTKQLLEELKPLSDKINVITYDFLNDKEEVEKFGVLNAPAYLMHKDGEDANGVFYGVPGGHEINTILTTLIDVSGASPLYDENILNDIKNIDKDVNVKVFVTTGCPHCPGAAINALRLAQLNKNIKAEVYEVHSNMEVSEKYQVQGVPKIVINETNELVGNQPIEEFLKVINA